MFGRLDRYVGKTVIGSYVATLTFVIFVWIIVDLLMKMSGLLAVAKEQGWSVLEVLRLWAQYHLVSLPWLYVLVAPFVSTLR